MKHLGLLLLLCACIPAAQGETPQVTTKAGTSSNYGLGVQGVTGGVPLTVSGSFSATTTGRATAAAPSYTEGTDNPLSIDLSGNIRTLATAQTAAKATAADPSYTEGTTNPISQDLSGHLRTNASLPAGAATSAKQDTGNTSLASIDGKDFATQTTLALIKAKTDNLDVALSTRTKPADTQNVAGTFWPTTAGAPSSCRLSDGAAFYDGTKTGQLPAALDGSGYLKVHEQGTATVAGSVTANIGTTNGLALDATLNGLLLAQGSTTSGQTGPLTQCAVTTSPPSYTTGQTSPINCTIAGRLRVSEDLSQVGGTNVSTGTGAGGAGIPRVTVSSDSQVKVWDGTNTQAVKAASTAAAAADPSAVVAFSPNSPLPTGSNVIGALSANQSTNVAQFGGTNVVTGTGAGGSGIPRVTISNDSSLAANQSVNLAQVGGTNTLTGGTAGSLGVGGLAAAGGASSGNPVYTAFRDTAGVAVPIICDKSAFINPTTATTTQIIALSGSTVIYVCAYEVNFVGSATANTGIFKYGTGASCATGPVSISATFFGPTATGGGSQFNMGHGIGYLFKTIAGQALCFTTSGATTAGVMVSYAQF